MFFRSGRYMNIAGCGDAGGSTCQPHTPVTKMRKLSTRVFRVKQTDNQLSADIWSGDNRLSADQKSADNQLHIPLVQS